MRITVNTGNTAGRSGQCKLCIVLPETATVPGTSPSNGKLFALHCADVPASGAASSATHIRALAPAPYPCTLTTSSEVKPTTDVCWLCVAHSRRGKPDGEFLKRRHPTREQIGSTDLVDRQVGAIDVGGGVAEQEADDARHGLRRHHASVQRTQRRHARLHHGLARLLPVFCDHLGRQPRRHRLRAGQQQHSVKLATAVGSENRNR